MSAVELADAPSCPLCGGEMERRANAWGAFWGCTAYPNCQGLIPLGRGAGPRRSPAAVRARARMDRRLTPADAAVLRPVAGPGGDGLPTVPVVPLPPRSVLDAGSHRTALALARALLAALGG